METKTTTTQSKKDFISPEMKIIPLQISTVLMMSNENTHEEDLF